MTGTLGIGTPKVRYVDRALAAATLTAEIDLEGGTLIGITIPEVVSTTIEIQAATATAGTFRTLRDPFGLYGTEDTDISLAIGTTSVGYYPVPPDITFGIRFIKLLFSASETLTVTAVIRSVE